MKTNPLTKSDLASRYPECEWRAKLLDLMALVEILSQCIIDDDYKVPVELHNAVILTEAGKSVRQRLITRESLKPNDATLLCLLEPVHTEPLVDIERTDLERLRGVISESIRNGHLRFPMTFGRRLYDRAVELFPEEKHRLTHEETMRLLEGGEQGAFHHGPFLLGPFGLLRTPHRRTMSPSHSVPLQHCSDLSCPTVHRVHLDTSSVPAVNRERPALHKVLAELFGDAADWTGFFADLVRDEMNPYLIEDFSSLPALLGDALDDDELRAFVRYAAKHTDGRLLRAAVAVGLPKQLERATRDLSRAQALQLLLTEDDASLARLLDRAVNERTIVLRAGEVRRPMVNRGTNSGAWRLRPELSRFGFRAVSSTPSVVWLRMAAIIRRLYDSADAQEMDDLAWVLRGEKGQTTKERLEHFLRTTEPRSVLRRLVLARRKNAESVQRELGVGRFSDDEELLDALMWKLGFPDGGQPDVRESYWSLHSELDAVTKTYSAALEVDENRVRGTASNYFVALERFLFDSLSFATFALVHDHYKAERPFRFYLNAARSYTVATLNATGDSRNALSEKPVLSEILQGYIRLSQLLDRYAQEAPAHTRPRDEYPDFVGKTDLQQFPFAHTVPFLDLTNSSRRALVEGLAAVGSGLNDSGILACRNDLLHARSDMVDVSVLGTALRKARGVLDRLEELGCVRTTFKPSTSTSDPWGRSIITLRASDREISFFYPSGFEFMELPSVESPVYLVQGAIFAEPNEMVRLVEGFESPFEEYWNNFPIRPKRSRAGISDAATRDGDAATGAGINA